MPLKLTLEITAPEADDIVMTLGEVARLIESGYLTSVGGGHTCSFHYDIEGIAESQETTTVIFGIWDPPKQVVNFYQITFFSQALDWRQAVLTAAGSWIFYSNLEVISYECPDSYMSWSRLVDILEEHPLLSSIGIKEICWYQTVPALAVEKEAPEHEIIFEATDMILTKEMFQALLAEKAKKNAPKEQ